MNLKCYQKMKGFESYLKRKGHSAESRTTYQVQVNHYLHWLKGQQLEIIQTTNNDLLGYMKYCSNKGNSQRTIQLRLTSITHYYNHLKKEGTTHHNPTTGIEIKGVKRDTLYHILEPYELNDLYHKHPAETPAQRRNKVVLGLVVYQGLSTTELKKLQLNDVKVREGELHVPRTRKSNSRTMKLESQQIFDLYDYLQQVRPAYLQQQKPTDKLLLNQTGSMRFDIIARAVVKQMKKDNPQAKTLKQIRASVITKWLKMYNLREAQYLAGHRYISSTEKYQQNDLEGLQEEINQFHPLG